MTERIRTIQVSDEHLEATIRQAIEATKKRTLAKCRRCRREEPTRPVGLSLVDYPALEWAVDKPGWAVTQWQLPPGWESLPRDCWHKRHDEPMPYPHRFDVCGPCAAAIRACANEAPSPEDERAG